MFFLQHNSSTILFQNKCEYITMQINPSNRRHSQNADSSSNNANEVLSCLLQLTSRIMFCDSAKYVKSEMSVSVRVLTTARDKEVIISKRY